MISIELTLSNIDKIAHDFLKKTENYRHFAFYGSMGAGKTTFIKAICKALGVTSAVTSPTFALVNEYDAGSNGMIYHFDFYRINKAEEVFDFGCEEYFASGGYCFVEWPEKAEIVLPTDVCRVDIKEQSDGVRKVAISFPPHLYHQSLTN